jgi:hypothetical protein
MGRTKARTVSKLMDVANRFSDGEDAYHNKRARSPDIAVRGANLAIMRITTLTTK